MCCSKDFYFDIFIWVDCDWYNIVLIHCLNVVVFHTMYQKPRRTKRHIVFNVYFGYHDACVEQDVLRQCECVWERENIDSDTYLQYHVIPKRNRSMSIIYDKWEISAWVCTKLFHSIYEFHTKYSLGYPISEHSFIRWSFLIIIRMRDYKLKHHPGKMYDAKKRHVISENAIVNLIQNI